MEKISLIIATITFFVTFASFFFALKIEMKKNSEKLINTKIENEKRHSSHERGLDSLNERFTFFEKGIQYRLDEINRKISALQNSFISGTGEAKNAG